MYYVYTLTDPRCGEVFYVGKGKGRRIAAHTKEALRGVQSHKCNKIRSIIADGHEVVSEVVREFKREDAAFRYEKKLIAKIGLENLTNIEPGGRGDCRGARTSNDAVKIDRALGEILARVLKHIALRGGVWIFGRDMTKEFNRFVDAMIAKYGDEKIIKLVRPFGVELTLTRA
ncbi:MAG: GIY-YIG nuclease family protein [Xanthobacteraceae bacterium]|nr:GIY-YIG nuclease family protein [Xanthobacteraceae bacterium]